MGDSQDLLLKDRIALQFVAADQQVDLPGIGDQIDHHFQGGVAAAHHGHVLVGEKRGVAGGTIGHAPARKTVFAGNIEAPAPAAGGHDHGLGPKGAAFIGTHLKGAVRSGLNRRDPLAGSDLHLLLGPDMFLQLFRQLPAGDGDFPHPVFNIGGDQGLAAEFFDDDHGLQLLPGGIDGRGGPGRAAADDDGVIGLSTHGITCQRDKSRPCPSDMKKYLNLN